MRAAPADGPRGDGRRDLLNEYKFELFNYSRHVRQAAWGCDCSCCAPACVPARYAGDRYPKGSTTSGKVWRD